VRAVLHWRGERELFFLNLAAARRFINICIHQNPRLKFLGEKRREALFLEKSAPLPRGFLLSYFGK
jgi:hypothetical protein